MVISAPELAGLERAGYRLVGGNKHSAVKVCHWTKKSLLDKGFCFKQKFYKRFYGIESHRCLQMTPSMPFCDHKCVYCWRDISITYPNWEGPCDEPAEILDGAIEAQRRLLSGFKGNPNANRRKWEEAQDPTLCAISLAGEPTLYPKLSELIAECHRRGMAAFLVTNGQHPERLREIVEPTQLYISVVAPDEKTYLEVCRPQVSDGWKRLNESLELMPSFKCRKVIRLTLVKGLNLKNAEGYARLIEKARADFVEPKSYFAVGYSRYRLGPSFMPSHAEVKIFAEELAKLTGYAIVDESEPSRVVLLRNVEK
ncbi:MAG: 4-demethylwyosine synthase TYW1 [Hadesarchaea archaeon]|nr:4-demethylwyosine synthase TYW1 [Hadesarchaea archaeon]